MTGTALRLACLDADTPPLFGALSAGREREGFEPAVAALIAGQLDCRIEWVPLAWDDLVSAAVAGRADAVLCGMSIPGQGRQAVAFTRPYAAFVQGILVPRGVEVRASVRAGRVMVEEIDNGKDPASNPAFGLGVLVDAGTVGASVAGRGRVLRARRAEGLGETVDGRALFAPIGEHDPNFDSAVVLETNSRWGLAVAANRPDLLAALNAALETVIANGQHRLAWDRWLPRLPYPLLKD